MAAWPPGAAVPSARTESARTESARTESARTDGRSARLADTATFAIVVATAAVLLLRLGLHLGP